MQKTITIPIKELNVLRKTFNEALLIINSLGGEQRGVSSESRSSSSKPRETKRQAINNYKNKIALGERVKKPDYLKSKSH
jgi:hypothetical protein